MLIHHTYQCCEQKQNVGTTWWTTSRLKNEEGARRTP